MPRKPGRPNTPRPIEEHAEQLATMGYRPAEIVEALWQEYGDRAPRLRKVQAIVARVRRQPSEPWDWERSDPEDAALVLRSLAAITALAGRRVPVTEAQAERIARIARVAPDLLPGEVWALSNAPQDAARDYLMFRPWESDEAAERYRRAHDVAHVMYSKALRGAPRLELSEDQLQRIWTQANEDGEVQQ